MEPENSSLQPPGLPRLVSRIPLPTYGPSKSLKPSPSRERLQADPGVDVARLRRPSEEALFKKPFLRPSSPIKERARSLAPRGINQDRVAHYGNGEKGERTAEDGWDSDTGVDIGHVTSTSRGPRPSLSDRTIETLSRIPPSPSPRGRKSAFIATEPLPMRSPSRPPSSMNSYSRSSSRSSVRQPGVDESIPLFSASVRRAPPVKSASTASRTSVPQRPSSLNTETPSKLGGRQSMGLEKPNPSQRAETLPTRTAGFGACKSLPRKPSKPRPSLSSAFTEPPASKTHISLPPLSIKKTRQPSSTYSSNLTSPSSTISKVSSTTSTTGSEAPPSELLSREPESRKVSKSSSALRESIAKAKAARKAARQSNVDTTFHDPFSQPPKEPNRGLVRKRVGAARTSGLLNIAALGLKEIPPEVLMMYDFDPDNQSDWYQSVDLVKLVAADNALEGLFDGVFPDIDPNDIDPDEDSKGSLFGGLELLDLHGNILTSLPIGLRRLQRLHSLNLSNNKLTMDKIEVITQIRNLADLKLAHNGLEGGLLPAVGHLHNLEVLDLRGNGLTDLPDTMVNLGSLKVLNLGENSLTSLPMEALNALPLIELNAQQNKLRGTLIPATVHRLSTLQTLNVANNALDQLSGSNTIEFPNLQILSIDANRLRILPCMSSWTSLVRITAEDNGIAVLPEGLVELKSVRHVDFTGNDLSQLDERIGLMDNLVTFRIANNPLRERKFLSMDTEDLKQNLRSRCMPEPQEPEEEEEGSVATEFTLAPESPNHLNAWKVKPGGILDRSSTGMTEMEVDILESLVSSQPIKCLYIHHNKLRDFPIPALNLLANTLTDLDLSNNALESPSFITGPLSLPHLQNLNLSGASLTELEPLRANIAAPLLKFMDVSNNRLTGALPIMRSRFPNLMTLLIADNQISSLDFEAVRGLQVLDVSNNNIDFLPPKLGLLGDIEGSSSSNRPPILRRFEVAGNSFRVPRWQIVAKGTEAVLEWLKGRIPAEELRAWEEETERDAESLDAL